MKYLLTIMVVLLLSNCKKDKEEKKHAIGERYQGGIIAYILQCCTGILTGISELP